jgi:probable rRNA maturation factor
MRRRNRVLLIVSRLNEAEPAWVDAELEHALAAIAVGIGDDVSTVQLVLVDDAYIRRINREFRDKDEATDVISFSYLSEHEILPDETDIDGEIYISFETIEREANQRGLNRPHLFLRIAVHGLLHVIGFDHVDDAGAARMETEERKILAGSLADEEIEPLFR